METTLFVLDQHAVDERIQLEKLLDVTFGANNDKKNFSSQEVSFHWNFSPYELDILSEYFERVKEWSKCISEVVNSSEWSLQLIHVHKKTIVEVTRVPCVFGVSLSQKEALTEFLGDLKSHSGKFYVRPKALF